MGKLTFRRILSGALLQTKVNACLPIVGSAAFLVGSILFWPTIELRGPISSGDWGAGLFLAGSVLFLITPVVDFFDLSYSLQDMTTESESKPVKQQPGGESRPLLFDYEGLYKAQMLRTQRANTLLYAVSGLCFSVGSVFFFPAQKRQSTQGVWLYLMGCVLSFLAAFLAAATALESKKTRKPTSFPRSAGCLALWWWDDETAQVASCSLYMLGDLIYAVGSICYFPQVILKGNALVLGEDVAEQAAVVLFIFGSVAFASGATIDFLVLLRAGSHQDLRPAGRDESEGAEGTARAA